MNLKVIVYLPQQRVNNKNEIETYQNAYTVFAIKDDG